MSNDFDTLVRALSEQDPHPQSIEPFLDILQGQHGNQTAINVRKAQDAFQQWQEQQARKTQPQGQKQDGK